MKVPSLPVRATLLVPSTLERNRTRAPSTGLPLASLIVPWIVPAVGVSCVVETSGGGGVSWADKGRLTKALKRKDKDEAPNKHRHHTGFDNKATLSWEQNVKRIPNSTTR